MLTQSLRRWKRKSRCTWEGHGDHKCHLYLLQPSRCTINTRWHFKSFWCAMKWYYSLRSLKSASFWMQTWWQMGRVNVSALTKPRDLFGLKSGLIKNQAGGFTLRCTESCHRSIFWAAGWAWWSSGNPQSSSSWRWCQAAKSARPCCCWGLTVSWCCCIWDGCLSTSGRRWCQFDIPKRHDCRC